MPETRQAAREAAEFLLSRAGADTTTPEGRAQLARVLCEAMRATIGEGSCRSVCPKAVRIRRGVAALSATLAAATEHADFLTQEVMALG